MIGTATLLLVFDLGVALWLLVAMVTLLVGGLIIVGALVLARKRMRFRNAVATAEGTVLKSTHSTREVGGRTLVGSLYSHTNYYATINAQYEQKPGERLEVTDKIGIPLGGPDYFDGDKITVFYDPNNPKNAKLARPSMGPIVRKVIVSTVLGFIVMLFSQAAFPWRLFEPSPPPHSASEIKETAPSSTATAPLSLERAKRGEALFQSLRSRNKADAPAVDGLSSYATLQLKIAQDEWGTLAKEQQIDISYYVESLIPKVRSYPEGYIIYKPSDSLYADYMKSARTLCDDCWEISIGKQEEANEFGTIQNPDVVVMGDKMWEHRDSRYRGIRGSNFRVNTSETPNVR